MIATPRPLSEWSKLVHRGGVQGYLVLGLLLILTAAWVKLIWPQWTGNPDLSHGLFTPILFLLLLKESRQRGPGRFLTPRPALWVTCAGVSVLSLITLIVSALFASAMDWSHPVVLFLLGGCMTGAWVCAWLFAASSGLRLVPFNYIAAVAVLLWFLSVPLPPGTYSQLTLTMQLWVSDRVLQTLHLIGIPAIQNGNVIELAHTSVGVEEACSGVRSLISCIYAGFFFSAAFVQHNSSRLALVVLAPLLAIGMNFVRSLTLTLLAHQGIDIEGTWHDLTGFAILGITAVLLGALALLMERLEPPRDSPAPDDAAAASAPSSRPGGRVLTASYTSAVACLAAFIFLTRPAHTAHSTIPAPRILSFLPAQADGWSIATTTGLYRFADVLETDHLGQRTYARKLPNGEVLQVTFYLAYWPPGQAGVSVVATHTPDACWPGAGWTPLPTAESQVRLTLPQRQLERAEYRRFVNDRAPQNVWFWHSYDREVIPEFNPRRPLELLKSVFDYGVRSNGDQLFVRMSSNQPWETFADDPLITEIFDRLAPYGL